MSGVRQRCHLGGTPRAPYRDYRDRGPGRGSVARERSMTQAVVVSSPTESPRSARPTDSSRTDGISNDALRCRPRLGGPCAPITAPPDRSAAFSDSTVWSLRKNGPTDRWRAASPRVIGLKSTRDVRSPRPLMVTANFLTPRGAASDVLHLVYRGDLPDFFGPIVTGEWR